MKATKIIYHKVFALPNFQNEKIGIEIELGEEDTAKNAMELAKRWSEAMHTGNKIDPAIERAKHIVANQDDYTGREVREAQRLIDSNNVSDDDLPF